QDQSITSGGWTTQLVTGTYNWTTSDAGSTGNFYGMMSNWTGSGNVASEAWLISPAIDLSASTNATFDFRNASNFSGPNMEVLVSTDYDGVSAPSTATWTQLGANLSTGGFAWVSGGPLSLNSYLTNGVYLAFKYTGTASSGKTWEVDDIVVTW
ncbi:MAG TPA: choice-of-anchor J domain-containing protein, partial [Vicingaceae bacterium]